MIDDLPVPAGWRDAAEEVRAHLCSLRGSGPFLSSADALQLVAWFEDDVSVVHIVAALERVARSRRAANSRIPLALVHARRHLGRASPGVFAHQAPVIDPQRPFAPVLRALKSAPKSAARTALEAQLESIEPTEPERLMRRALGCVREFFDALWAGLSSSERAEMRARAEQSLGDLVDLVDETTASELVEEATRDQLRSGYPVLTAASLWEVVAPRGLHGS